MITATPISKKVIQNVLDFYNKHNRKAWTTKDYSYHQSIRALGFLEAVLQMYGKLTPDKDITSKGVIYRTPKYWGLFGKLIEKERKQTWSEMIVELTKKLLNEL